MKIALLLALAVGSLLSLVGCAGEPPAPKADDRLGGRSGVVVGSRDMSRVAPTRPELNKPPY